MSRIHPSAALEPWPELPAETLASDKGPAFIRSNFELRRAQTERGPGAPVVRRWLRLKQPTGLDPISDLVLLGDTLPPGAMRTMQRLGPNSASRPWVARKTPPSPTSSPMTMTRGSRLISSIIASLTASTMFRSAITHPPPPRRRA